MPSGLLDHREYRLLILYFLWGYLLSSRQRGYPLYSSEYITHAKCNIKLPWCHLHGHIPQHDWCLDAIYMAIYRNMTDALMSLHGHIPQHDWCLDVIYMAIYLNITDALLSFTWPYTSTWLMPWCHLHGHIPQHDWCLVVIYMAIYLNMTDALLSCGVMSSYLPLVMCHHIIYCFQPDY